MLNRAKKYFTKDKNLRDKLRGQEIIIETLMLEISKSEDSYELFKFILENKEISCSRNYSDLVALFYLGNSQSYLEIGAGEPIIGSDTFLLEQEMQWTGIQVEPDMQTFNKLQMARPNSIQINAAIVGDSDKSEYFLNPHTMRLSKKKKNFKRIKTMNMYDIQNKGVKFDALFIDIEGNELDVISSKSFMDFNFKFINIEMIWNNSRIYQILSEYGYKQVGTSFSSYSGWFINEF
jgi:FkbM family methyltransferase